MTAEAHNPSDASTNSSVDVWPNTPQWKEDEARLSEALMLDDPSSTDAGPESSLPQAERPAGTPAQPTQKM